MAAVDNKLLESIVSKYDSYQDYVNSMISREDKSYFSYNEDALYQLYSLGIHGNNWFSEEDFNRKRTEMHLSHMLKARTRGGDIISQGLASREQKNLATNVSTIIFLRMYNPKRQEISGYIDYRQRLKTDDFKKIFDETDILMPRQGDLSFFNYDTRKVTSKETPNFYVIDTNKHGLLFKNKHDLKMISVKPALQNTNAERVVVKSKNHLQAVFYDHLLNNRY